MTSSLPDIPLIPPEVYASRDRGDLVLFCGAGVSVDAGCPTFGELACLVEDEFGPFGDQEDEALNRGQFDVYLQLVENRVDEGAANGHVRKFVRDQLLKKAKTTAVHESILKLALRSDGAIRLVTTNYDRHFGVTAEKLGLAPVIDSAPRVVSPRSLGWNSIVHLHGALDGGDLRHLVLTGADFGRAYLTEGWAANFVTELLEHFDVLFLGYSAEDVVMKYALGANAQRRAGHGRQLWSLATPRSGESVASCSARWAQLGVTLIPYEAQGGNHGQFAAALADWSSIIESRATRRGRIELILNEGTSELNRDGRKSQLQWLLGDVTCDGVRALYVERNGVRRPSHVDWLDEFAKLGLLEQRGQREATLDKDRQLVRSPFVGQSFDQIFLGERASAFAGWIADLAVDGGTRPDGRSNSEDLLNWMQQAGREAALHPALVDLIRRRMSDGVTVLTSELRDAWRLVLDPSVNDRLSPRLRQEVLWALHRELAAGQADNSTVQQVLDALRPVAVFQRGSTTVQSRERFRAFRERLNAEGLANDPDEGKPQRHDYAQPSIVLRCGESEALRLAGKLMTSPARDAVLRSIAIGANHLLERALELLAQTQPDLDYIESHQYQRVGDPADNSRRHAWTLLADLSARCGATLDKVGDPRAQKLLDSWLADRHITNRRLALHAAVKWDSLTIDRRRDALAGGSPPWLHERALAAEVLEVLRRLEVQEGASSLNADQRSRLEELKRAQTPSESTTFTHERPPRADGSEPKSLADATDQDLASILLGEREAMVKFGLSGIGSEQLIQDVGPLRTCVALDLALERHAPRPTQEFAGGRIIDSFPDQAARCLLAVVQHAKESDSESAIHTNDLLSLWDKLEPVAMGVERGEPAGTPGEEISNALNHPAGKLLDALFEILWSKSDNALSSLDHRLTKRLERNLTKPGGAGRAFLTIAASNLAILHHADSTWTAEVLTPNFDWKTDETRARTCWSGYLLHPHLNADLYARLHDSFLDTFQSADQLGDRKEALSELLVSLALDATDLLHPRDTRRAIRGMPADLRVTAAWHLWKRLKSAQGTAAELARARVLPWLKTWPPDGDVWRNAKLADEMTELALACQGAVTEAISFIVEQPHLKLGRWPLSLHAQLEEHQDLFSSHAPAIARLFDHVLPSREDNLRLGGQVWGAAELQQLVDKLREAGATVTSTPEFRRLEARL